MREKAPLLVVPVSVQETEESQRQETDGRQECLNEKEREELARPHKKKKRYRLGRKQRVVEAVLFLLASEDRRVNGG